MITARPANPADATALAALFEATGSSCYCRYFHFEGDKNDWLARCALEPDQNRAEMVTALESGSDDGHGIAAEADGSVIGWAKIAPAYAIKKAYAQRYYARLPTLQGDREGVWLLACFLVHPDWRRKGTSRALIRAAIEEARRLGARSLEALPSQVAPPARDEELFTGSIEALEKEGFGRAGGDPAYPVMRIDLTSEKPT
ncbi:MAG: GNAT family N-acetyltransferase [Polyangiaceae bacterium]|nr:GNAT family N-acetyltransferase [Polyangiaceae bacterium]